MKEMEKSRAKESIAQLVLGLIKSKNLTKSAGKDAAKVLIPAVKKAHPGSKFNQSQVSWYLGRYRRQVKERRTTEHLVNLKPAKGR